MKYHDMQKPLVQSALVLLAILVVIGFVAGSGADSFFGGIVSIIKGVIYTVLFAFALIVGLLFSVVLLIAIFLGAVSLYSSDKAKEMYANIRQRTTDLFMSWTNRSQRQRAPAATSSSQNNTAYSNPTQQEAPQFAKASSLMSLEKKFSSELAEIKQSLNTINSKSGSLDTSLETLQTTVTSLPVDDIFAKIEQLEAKQQKVEAKLDESLEKIEKASKTSTYEEEYKRLGKEIGTVQEQIQAVAKELEEFRTSAQQSESTSQEASDSAEKEDYRIFAYLEKEEDKKQFAKYVSEAVEKNMTYAEIDEFLSKSLPKKVDTIIKEHPSLTKEYIREHKNS